ncbi:hypothetical protein AB0G05_13755 [Nonomuraea wenchangensis]
MSGRDRSNPHWSAVPAEVLKDFDAYLTRIHGLRHVHPLQTFSSGFSGAQVLLVEDKIGRRQAQQRVLKFCPNDAEPDQISIAYEGAPPDFARDHLAKVVDKVHHGKCAAVFMAIAGQDLSNCRSLAEHLRQRDPADICRTVIPSLLRGWNAGRTDLSSPYTVAEYLRSLIGVTRLGDAGSIATFLARAGIDPRAETVRLSGWGRELRNPLTLADLHTPAGASLVPDGALVGDGHGDLNIFNLLIPDYPDFAPEQYQIIDYGGGVEQPLTWDSMYLLVSMATRWLSQMNLASDSPSHLVRVLARPRGSGNDFGLSEHRAVAKAIYDAGYEWAKSTSYANRWLPQCALSLCAAALRFIGRQIPGVNVSLDDWFFELAAEAADTFAEEAHLAPGTGITHIASARQRRGQRAGGTSQAGGPSDDVAEFVRLLKEADFGGDWADVRRGTSSLRAYLKKEREHATGSPHAISIRTLTDGLRAALNDAIDARLAAGTHGRAARRAGRIARTLQPLLLA